MSSGLSIFVEWSQTREVYGRQEAALNVSVNREDCTSGVTMAMGFPPREVFVVLVDSGELFCRHRVKPSIGERGVKQPSLVCCAAEDIVVTRCREFAVGSWEHAVYRGADVAYVRPRLRSLAAAAR